MALYDFSGEDIKLLHTYTAEGGYVLSENEAPTAMTYQIDGNDYTVEDFISETSALSELCEKELGYSLFTKDLRNDNYIVNSALPNSCGCNMLS